MIDPKPKTILELYEGHPERWIKGQTARDSDGVQTIPQHPKAVCWCLSGAIAFVYSHLFSEERVAIRKKLQQAILHQDKIVFSSCIVGFNDNPLTHFDDVLKVVKEAKI